MRLGRVSQVLRSGPGARFPWPFIALGDRRNVTFRRLKRGNVTLRRWSAVGFVGTSPSARGLPVALVEHRYLELLRVAGAKIWRWLVARDRIADSAAVDRLFRGLR